MSRFNVPTNPSKILNAAGGSAYELSPEYKLYSLVCTCLINDQYYRAGQQGLADVQKLVKECDPEFVANLCVYARKEMRLRSLPIAMAVMTCRDSRFTGKRHKRDYAPNLARQTISRTIQRADEITEALAFFSFNNTQATTKTKGAHQLKNGMAKRPGSLIRGIRDVFESGRFDRYQLSKYSGSKGITLKDALFLSHPNPKSNSELTATFGLLASGKLEPAYTWESEFSKLGQKFKGDELENAKMAKWAELIQSKRLGHMALLRNLRNVLELKPGPAFLTETLDQLVNGAKNGKQFPFRYYSAYKALTAIDPFAKIQVTKALNECLKESVRSYPNFEGNNLIAIDTSGSMDKPLSEKSDIALSELGLVLGLTLANSLPNTVSMMFGEEIGLLEHSGAILQDIQKGLSLRGQIGHSTNGYKVLAWALDQNIVIDNLIMFTDCQLYGGDMQRLWQEYKRKHPKCKFWLFDLAGYGNTPLRVVDDVYLISGWSDRIFEVCNRLEQGISVVQMIKDYKDGDSKTEKEEDTV